MSSYVKKVHFKLHESYANPLRGKMSKDWKKNFVREYLIIFISLSQDFYNLVQNVLEKWAFIVYLLKYGVTLPYGHLVKTVTPLLQPLCLYAQQKHPYIFL